MQDAVRGLDHGPFTFKQYGGSYGGLHVVVADMSYFSKGEEVIVFLYLNIDFLANDPPNQVTVFDRRGRQVRVLKNEIFQQGYNLVFWDGRDENGFALPSGIYFYRMRSGDFEQVKKLTLVK